LRDEVRRGPEKRRKDYHYDGDERDRGIRSGSSRPCDERKPDRGDRHSRDAVAANFFLEDESRENRGKKRLRLQDY
jgi:hypothetical protein